MAIRDNYKHKVNTNDILFFGKVEFSKNGGIPSDPYEFLRRRRNNYVECIGVTGKGPQEPRCVSTTKEISYARTEGVSVWPAHLECVIRKRSIYEKVLDS